MSVKATSELLDNEALARVDYMVTAINNPDTFLMTETIKQFVAHNEWFVLEVEKGVKAADEGRLLDHSDIKAKWEARRVAQ